VPGAKAVVRALVAPEEAGESAPLAQGRHAVAASSEDLVGISLVADVPNHPVVRRGEDVVQRHGELDHAQARRQMTAGTRDAVDQEPPQLLGETGKIGLGQATQVRRRPAPGERGCPIRDVSPTGGRIAIIA
jgi:hypothetical protein